MEGRKPLLVGRKEWARLYDVAENAINARWVPRGLVSYDDAVIVSGKYVWPGGKAIAFALPEGSNGRQLNQTALAALKEEQGATWEPAVKGELPPLMGAYEYAELYGVPHPQLSTYLKRESRLIAPPDYKVSGSAVWFVQTVLDYAEEAAAASRTGAWNMREDVAGALLDGTYDGPGSTAATRGMHARKSTDG
ncbi:hypothetical protein [Streptomyces abikoensis]|uniref:Uncharacterized protein n=1 Tax=Streptomyces abikoensis TaxID=97398 RepID=A0ABW7T4K8_9ACTN